MPGTSDPSTVEAWAREAGAILLSHHGRLEQVEKKGARDLVTAADREAEALIVARIREACPDDPILAEETRATQADAPRLWIVDPLDGTTNFVHRIPHFAVSIALYVDGAPVVACVFNPILDECFVATRGGGATLNGVPIRCRGEDRVSESVLATGFHYRREYHGDSNLQHFTDFAYLARGLRRLGSAALDLCYVAEGRFDGFWELHLSPWDVAGGALMVREAGGVVTDFSGGDGWLFGGEIVAANPQLAPRIREVLAAADPASLPGPRFEP
ncbi:MAG: inositol monophosphatase [Planctomycetes bacterium]|nr:inositol monophosphatase [Planctomycetota bacterium]